MGGGGGYTLARTCSIHSHMYSKFPWRQECDNTKKDTLQALQQGVEKFSVSLVYFQALSSGEIQTHVPTIKHVQQVAVVQQDTTFEHVLKIGVHATADAGLTDSELASADIDM